MKRTVKLAVLSCALAAALTLMLFACAKPVDAEKYDDGPALQEEKMSDVEKPADPAMEIQEGAEPQDAAAVPQISNASKSAGILAFFIILPSHFLHSFCNNC